uniref:Telomerase ribonucleoprotein complex - RNA-binding domain-containing protein n=1 Tax=Panagrolaimus sp. JU765 TaxID=591449 RepID=A0AC34Q420_9BILA
MDEEVLLPDSGTSLKKNRNRKKSRRNKGNLETPTLNLVALKWKDVDGKVFFIKKHDKNISGTIVDDLTAYVDASLKVEQTLRKGMTSEEEAARELDSRTYEHVLLVKMTAEQESICRNRCLAVLKHIIMESDMQDIDRVAISDVNVAHLKTRLGVIMDNLFAKWRSSCIRVSMDWVIPKYDGKHPKILIKGTGIGRSPDNLETPTLNFVALKWKDVDGKVFIIKKHDKNIFGTILDDLTACVNVLLKVEQTLRKGMTPEDEAARQLDSMTYERVLLVKMTAEQESICRHRCLSVLPKYDYKHPKILIKNPINTAQMAAFFRTLFRYFFPIDLFGGENSMNLKNLCKKIARAIMNAKAYEPIFDKHLILSGFKYNDMKWLIKLSAKDKIIMGQNFVRFFTYFCMEIVLKHLHCEADSNQLIRFYRKDIWTRIKKYSVEKFIVDRKAVEIDEKDSDYHYFLKKDVWTRIKKYSVEKFIIDRKAVEIDEKDSDYHYFLKIEF